jgi:hypothetical protein
MVDPFRWYLSRLHQAVPEAASNPSHAAISRHSLSELTLHCRVRLGASGNDEIAKGASLRVRIKNRMDEFDAYLTLPVISSVKGGANHIRAIINPCPHHQPKFRRQDNSIGW